MFSGDASAGSFSRAFSRSRPTSLIQNPEFSRALLRGSSGKVCRLDVAVNDGLGRGSAASVYRFLNCDIQYAVNWDCLWL